MNTKCLVALLAFTLCSVSSVRAETLEWIRQLGTSSSDPSWAASADGLGNIYISGDTTGSLGGPYVGVGWDAFVSKYDASGTLEWTRQLGTSSPDSNRGVSADGLGNVYISGLTKGSLGGPNAGEADAFVAKYDASGTLEWTQQLGTRSYDRGIEVSADGLGSVYISGSTEGSLGGTNAGGRDGFLSKYDASGTLEWTRQLGSSEDDTSYGVSADGLGSVYISGSTEGNLGGANAGGSDAFISKYEASGTLEWTRQLGSSEDDTSYGVSADGLGNVYISGVTKGSLGGPNAGEADAFVVKYDASGTVQWTQQLGTSHYDSSSSVSADGLGNVYLSGWTTGYLGGGFNAGGIEAFISKYNESGTLVWIRQLGTIYHERSRAVSADGLGNVYISGDTWGSLGGPNQGLADAFVAKFRGLPDTLLGDVNLDGEVNGLDADPFVEVLLSGPYQPEADMNSDSEMNGWDVDPFVDTVVGGVQQIPEPSTLLLALVALGVVGAWRKWKTVVCQNLVAHERGHIMRRLGTLAVVVSAPVGGSSCRLQWRR